MLTNLKKLYGYTLAAKDGDIGNVQDFYFDDKTWAVRYLVVDAGSWLSNRRVLISPHALGRLASDEKILHVNLTREQIENSPALSWHQQVSRQYEIEYYRYYGWATYWEGTAIWGFSDFPVALPPSRNELEKRLQFDVASYAPLRSTRVLKGYQILAADRAIGFLHDFVIDVRSWLIRELVVDNDHWYSEKEILISSSKIAIVDHDASEVVVDLMQADIQRVAENELARVGS